MSSDFFVPVRDVMTSEPITIDGLATVSDALQKMKQHSINALVVDRRDERDEFGLLLVADIARKVVSKKRPAHRLNVYEVMIKPAPAVDADMNIVYAVRHMTRHGLSHCIVLHNRELAGMATLRDMCIHYIDASAP